MYTCIFVYIYICIYIYICVYIYIYTRRYIYIYIAGFFAAGIMGGATALSFSLCPPPHRLILLTDFLF